MSKILIGTAVGVSTSIACAVIRWPHLSASIATLTVFGGVWASLVLAMERLSSGAGYHVFPRDAGMES